MSKMYVGARQMRCHVDTSDQLDPTRAMRGADEFLEQGGNVKSTVRRVSATVVRRVRK